MASKAISLLRAVVENETVQISGYKAALYFEDAENSDVFRTLRIWRKEETDFQFGRDYAEYFDGLSHSNATLIYEGPLDASNNRKFTFVDRDVTVGKTYAYWMAAAETEPAGPVGVKVRDPKVWWPESRIRAKVLQLKERFPSLVEVHKIGRTVQGRELTALSVGRGEKSIGLVGAVHAGESGPELILSALETLLADQEGLFEDISICAIPVVNLDERQREVEGLPWYLRTNSNGVDLNRNFPANWNETSLGYGLDSSDPDSATYRGRVPASEPEVQAVMSFLQEYKPIAVLAYHWLASVCGKTFIAPGCAADDTDYGTTCKQIVKSYCEGYSRVCGEQALTDDNPSFAGSAGSLPTWCYRELNIPAFDIEGSGGEPGTETARIDHTDEALLKEYQRRHTEGLRHLLKSVSGL
ncbi:MAG: hypothetical protein KAV00_05755 [Phycisphaerae bacterium]|nr:hypothetical protein [Phycisphaerae bacterium]